MTDPTRADREVRPLLEIVDVSRAYGSVRALDDVSLTIAENEFFALLGPSGCGKTTLLRSIAGFEAPDEGAILLAGNDLIGVPPNRRPVNLMFQSYALFPHMSVEKNVAYGLHREGLPRHEVTTRVDEVLEITGLSHLADRRPAQLSGGQRQRVALARAVVKRPRLLLLDEPLSALDRKVRAEMQLELKRLQHEVGITFVVVTHDQDEAMSMADRIAVMAEGRVQQVATPVELYHSPVNLFVADFIGTSNLIEGTVTGGRFAAPLLATRDIEVQSAGGMSKGPAHLVVRPEAVTVTDPAAGWIQGVVSETQFQGGTSTIAVEVAAYGRPFLVTVPGTTSVTRGQAVGLTWTDAVAVPEDLR